MALQGAALVLLSHLHSPVRPVQASILDVLPGAWSSCVWSWVLLLTAAAAAFRFLHANWAGTQQKSCKRASALSYSSSSPPPFSSLPSAGLHVCVVIHSIVDANFLLPQHPASHSPSTQHFCRRRQEPSDGELLERHKYLHVWGERTAAMLRTANRVGLISCFDSSWKQV